MPEFRRELQQAAVSAQAAESLERSLVTCFADQASGGDPGKLRPSCTALLAEAQNGMTMI